MLRALYLSKMMLRALYLSKMMLRAFAFVLLVACILLATRLIHERHLHMKIKEELTKTRQELTECNTKIEVQNAQIESMKADYEKKLKEFKKQRVKIEKIYEPLTIEIPQNINECQALQEMLNKYKEVERALP
ncbi:hypothetical protein [Sulfurihydrogenibium sp.]|uniref:hypothetical protein n=1 Tax=Sulfurihydrogenibium sp. TaxID=2053621 RepID=UPI002637C649|nr:hypothetical protein [Sulfurihydrogenibium sp.]